MLCAGDAYVDEDETAKVDLVVAVREQEDVAARNVAAVA
jgi:hypothetical protein